MKNKNLVLLALAIGCGLVAAFLTAKLGASNKAEMVPVLVAAKNLDQGTKLEKPEELFVRKPFPKESVPPDFLDDITTLKNKTLQRTVRAGSHVTLEDITSRQEISLPVDKGVMYKAMAISVKQETMAGGLVRPGSRVDVVATERLANGKTASTVILEKVLVVAVNDTTKPPEGEMNYKSATTVTLAVTQKEGQLLALAKMRGELSLMLRSPDDATVSNYKKPVTGFDEAKEEGAGAATPVVESTKVVVAKKNVPAGTKLDNPEDFFEVKDWPGEAPENSFASVDELKGKTINRDVFVNNFVPKQAFDAAEKKPAAETVKKEPVVTHKMIIQVGTSAPQHVHYGKDGRLLEGKEVAGSTSSAGIPAAPSTHGDSSPSISPEKSPEKSETKPEVKPEKDE